MNDPVLTTKEAAERLGVGDVTIQRYLRKGTLKGYRLATKSGWRVYASSIDALIQWSEATRGGEAPRVEKPTATEASTTEASTSGTKK